jgi:tetratricopeptide (TPR) repeat protein
VVVDLKVLRDQGEAAWGAGHWEPARAAYAAIVELDPADQVASQRLLECLLALGSAEEAMSVVEELLDRLEDRGELSGALAIAESLLSLSITPVLPLERSVRLHFRLDNVTAGLGRLRQLSDWHLEEGEIEQAIEVLRTAQERYPACVDIGMELGHLYIALGLIEEGTEQFRLLGHRTLDHNLEDAIEAFRRWDFLKRLNESA